MVLTDLASRFNEAFRRLTSRGTINDEAIQALLKDISNALMVADVNISLVMDLNKRLKTRLSEGLASTSVNKRDVIRKAVYAEVTKLLDPGTPEYEFTAGRRHIVLFVGLQGAGKTTTICKFGHYYKNRGWKPAVVCADTFRAGAFDQLMQNAAAARIHFYGDRTVQDPVALARKSIKVLSNSSQKSNMILIDSSGRHCQADDLFDEMKELADAVKPDLIIFVMDGSIGQSALQQAKAFKSAVNIGGVIVTKMDGETKGGGVLSAVASTKSPILFIGTGESLNDLNAFDPRSFVSRLFGWGDPKALSDFILTQATPERMQSIEKSLKEKTFTLRNMYDLLKQLMGVGNITNLLQSIPGMGSLIQNSDMQNISVADSCKRGIVVMDSMTGAELDKPKILNSQRIRRIARGSGTTLNDVSNVLDDQKKHESIFKNKAFTNALESLQAAGSGREMNIHEQLRALSSRGSLNNSLFDMLRMRN